MPTLKGRWHPYLGPNITWGSQSHGCLQPVRDNVDLPFTFSAGAKKAHSDWIAPVVPAGAIPGHAHVLLGFDWLWQHEAVVDLGARTITFWNKGTKHTINVFAHVGRNVSINATHAHWQDAILSDCSNTLHCFNLTTEGKLEHGKQQQAPATQDELIIITPEHWDPAPPDHNTAATAKDIQQSAMRDADAEDNMEEWEASDRIYIQDPAPTPDIVTALQRADIKEFEDMLERTRSRVRKRHPLLEAALMDGLQTRSKAFGGEFIININDPRRTTIRVPILPNQQPVFIRQYRMPQLKWQAAKDIIDNVADP